MTWLILCALLGWLSGCGDDDDDAGGSGGSGTAASGGSGGVSGGAGETAGASGGAGKTGGTGGGGATGPEFGEVPALLADAMCELVTACIGEAEVARFYGEGKCAERSLASIEDGDFGYAEEMIAAGRVTYNAGQVDACLESMKELGCDFNTSRFFRSNPCAQALAGSVQAGGECSTDAECLANSFCKLDSGCPGICTALLKAGQPCEDDDDCEDGLHCAGGTDLCAVVAPEGAPCGGGTAPECKMGLVCAGADEETGTEGVCKTQEQVFTGKLDGACDFDTTTLCEPGLSCVVSLETSDAGTQAVFACAEGVESGQACNLGAPPQCPAGEYCAGVDITNGVVNGTCQPLPAAGKDCVQDMAGQCAPGLVCDTDGKCHTVNRLGGACVSGLGCASETCEGGECVRPPKCEI